MGQFLNYGMLVMDSWSKLALHIILLIAEPLRVAWMTDGDVVQQSVIPNQGCKQHRATLVSHETWIEETDESLDRRQKWLQPRQGRSRVQQQRVELHARAIPL